jgi:hypothetical protein
MNKFLLLLALALAALSLPSQAQKLYKIVDDEGNVSFSQYPPMVRKENVTVDDISVNTGSRSIVSEELDGLYCGKIRLESQSTSSYAMKDQVKKLDSKRSAWRRELDQLGKKIDAINQDSINRNTNSSGGAGRYNTNYRSSQNKRYHASVEANSEKMRDLRCALGWVDEELDGTTEFVVDSKKERKRLEGIRKELQAKLHKDCGSLPTYNPNARGNDAKRKSWYSCSSKLRRDIDRVDKAIRKA